MQSLLFLPLAIANTLTARLNDGYVVKDCAVCEDGMLYNLQG